MPTIAQFARKKTTLLLTGVSGSGKSTLLSYAPPPIAMLLVDKDVPTSGPGVDSSAIYYKPYPPAEVKLDEDSYRRARNIADSLIKDVQLLKAHFVLGQPLKVQQFDGTEEEWPSPATVVVEGAAPIADHFLNRVLTINRKNSVDEFDNRFAPYAQRLQTCLDFYDILLRLPCNVIVTTWPEDETKTEKVNGKVESVKTGVVRPDMGGKLNVEGPGKFDSSLYCYSEQGKFYARTRNNAKFQGFKIGNIYGAPEVIDVTLDGKGDPWTKLFGKPNETKVIAA